MDEASTHRQHWPEHRDWPDYEFGKVRDRLKPGDKFTLYGGSGDVFTLGEFNDEGSYIADRPSKWPIRNSTRIRPLPGTLTEDE